MHQYHQLRVYNKEKLVNNFKEVHGNRYDYTVSVIRNGYDKIEIVCRNHGPFWQRPYTHLSGSGCPSCANNKKRLTSSIFIKKAKKIHRYDYTKTKYKGSMVKVEIICPTHGSFWQKPNDHLQGCGCPSCAIEKTRSTTRNFINQAKKIHRYDYTETKYKGSMVKVEIICPTHGSFWQKPNDHLQGHGCPSCAIERRKKTLSKNNKTFIRDSFRIHPKKYNYSKINYINGITKLEIICPNHGSFWQTPNSHLCGSGCPSCAKTGFDPNKSGTLYYLQDTITGLYKIGITNTTPKKRFSYFKARVKIIREWFFENGADAHELEQFLHSEFASFRIVNKNWSKYGNTSGKTEFFKEDILRLNS